MSNLQLMSIINCNCLHIAFFIQKICHNSTTIQLIHYMCNVVLDRESLFSNKKTVLIKYLDLNSSSIVTRCQLFLNTRNEYLQQNIIVRSRDRTSSSGFLINLATFTINDILCSLCLDVSCKLDVPLKFKCISYIQRNRVAIVLRKITYLNRYIFFLFFQGFNNRFTNLIQKEYK